MMKKPNSGSSGSSKANDHAPNALPPKKRPTPDELSPSPPPSPDAAAVMATRMLAEAEWAAVRAENKAALREALGKRVLKLVAERVSTEEATATLMMASSSGSGKGPAAAQNRPTKVLKREPIRARLPEGRGVVSVQLTAEERRSQARAARSGLEQMKAEREMAENKAEHRPDAEWAKEQEDRRTQEERERDDEEADALHERLRLETPFAQHYERKVNETNGAQFYRVMPRLSAEHPLLEDAEGLDDDHSLVFVVVDAEEYEPPTYFSFKDIKRRTIGRALTELPFTCRFGADLVFHETLGEVQGRARQALRDGRAAAHLPRDPPTQDDKKLSSEHSKILFLFISYLD